MSETKKAAPIHNSPAAGGFGNTWFYACLAEDVPDNGGVCVKYNDEQIALFYFTRRGEWYATQNECPHRGQMALSRGMIGAQNDEPKVACPFHKKTFSLKTGQCLTGDEQTLKTYPVKVEDGKVFIGMVNNQQYADADSYRDQQRMPCETKAGNQINNINESP